MRAEVSWDHAAWLDDRINGLLDAAAITPDVTAAGSRTSAARLARAAGYAVVSAGLVTAIATLSGCGSTGGNGITSNKPQDVNAGLNALANDNRPTPDELHKFIERAATDLEDLKAAQEERRRRLAQVNMTPPSESPAANPTATPADPAAAPDSSLASLAGTTANATPESAPAATTPNPAPTPTPTAQDRVRALAAELRTVLNQQVSDPESSVSSALALAVLEMLNAQESGGGAPSMGNLSDRERQAVQSVRELIEGLAKDPAAASDPSRVAQMLARSMDALSSARSVRVARAELCTRVEAFGRFKPFEVNAFVAGRAHRVIVYTEVENYAYRDMGEGATNGNRWAVELGQELQLYTGDGSMLAWRKPEEATGETSRNKRRDFYITQMVELPRTLTVGAYSMKVVLRDKVSGAKAEAIIPIQIVADEALARGESR